MHNEDDTFQELSRSPFEQVRRAYSKWWWDMLNVQAITLDDKNALLSKYGWTYEGLTNYCQTHKMQLLLGPDLV